MTPDLPLKHYVPPLCDLPQSHIGVPLNYELMRFFEKVLMRKWTQIFAEKLTFFPTHILLIIFGTTLMCL